MDGKYGGEGHEAAGHSSSAVACKERKGLLVLRSVSEFLPEPQPTHRWCYSHSKWVLLCQLSIPEMSLQTGSEVYLLDDSKSSQVVNEE